MNPQRFDALIQRMTEAPRSRRRALLLVVGAASSARIVGGVGTPAVAAASCHKVGKPCKRADQCCSGICHGKHGEKKCRSHGAGSCRHDQDACTDPHQDLDLCNNANCACYRTIGGSSFCADLGGAGGCAACERDADCVALGFPPGSACGAFAAGRCSGFCASGAFCLVPCSAATSTAAAERRPLRGPTPPDE